MPSPRIPVLAFASACWAAPSVARACEPSWPDTATFPPPGSQLPRNAAVRITGEGAGLVPEAQVDGGFAKVVEVAELGAPEQSTGEMFLPVVVVRVDPRPQIGATIEFLPQFEPPLVYTAGPSDTTPPAPLTDVSVDLHDYAIPGCETSCNHGFALNYWLTLVGGAQDDGSPVVHNIFLDDTGSGTDGKLIYTIMAGSQQRVLLPRRAAWEAEHDPVHDVCFTVRTFDTAMNEAAVAHRVCKLCRARLEPGDPGGRCLHPDVEDEPVWGPEDAVRDGACNATPIPPLPAPPPEPDTTTGDDSTGDPSTGDDSTGDPSTGDPSTTTSTTTATTSTDPSPEPTGTTALPTTGDPPSNTTAAPPPGGSTGSSAGGDDGLVDHGCACNETSNNAPQSLLLLLGVALRLRRPRR